MPFTEEEKAHIREAVVAAVIGGNVAPWDGGLRHGLKTAGGFFVYLRSGLHHCLIFLSREDNGDFDAFASGETWEEALADLWEDVGWRTESSI